MRTLGLCGHEDSRTIRTMWTLGLYGEVVTIMPLPPIALPRVADLSV